jgi:hypothetical protein
MKITAVVLACFVTSVLAACATPATPAQAVAALQSQVVKQCTIVQPFIVSMQAMQPQLSADAQTQLAAASTDIAKVCAFASAPASATPVTFSLADVSTLVNSAFPSLIKIVDGSTLSAQEKSTAEIAITAAQLGVSMALANAQ